MQMAAYNRFCQSLPHTTHVVQWGGADVWKVGGKVFAIGWAATEKEPNQFTFKVSPMSFEIMKDQPGLRPAPYLASRGMSWIQHYDVPGLTDKELKAYIEASHGLVAAGLTKKLQRELGFLPPKEHS
ncbi:MAG: MmcQ/YjbR family DNA-binding protein [Pseudomonadota bacterium]